MNVLASLLSLLHPGRGDGRLLMTPECSSFEEPEGQINSLQDELDELREEPAGLPSRLKSMLLQKKSDDQS